MLLRFALACFAAKNSSPARFRIVFIPQLRNSSSKSLQKQKHKKYYPIKSKD